MTDTSSLIRDAFGGGMQQGRLNAVTAVDDDPEKAARAMQLVEGTDVPASVAYGDLETHEREQRQLLTSGIIAGNPKLAEYANSHPMAAKVSNDDWGQLDSVAHVLGKLRVPMSPLNLKQHGSIAGAAVSAFRDSWDWSLGKWMGKEGEELENTAPYSAYLYRVLGAPIEIPAKVLGSGLHALNATIEESGYQLGMERSNAKRLARDVTAMAEYQLNQTPGRVGIPKFGEALASVEPWIRGGREPPTGMNALIDNIFFHQNKLDMENLEEGAKEFQKSATWARNQELARIFAEQQVGKAEIGISADAVAKLYGDKLPKPDDNLLGWVPEIESQMARALATGGDISVPMADWLVRADPEVRKALHDHVRVRRNGMTLEEGANISGTLRAFEVFHGSPHEFEAFSLEKVGTGEGAQVRGWGAYLAGAEETARTYKTAGPGVYNIGGVPYNANDPVHVAAQMVYTYGNEQARDMLDEARRNARYAKDDKMEAFYLKAKNLVADKLKLPEVTLGKGQLYKARVHVEPEQLLDLDKPLSQQTPEIQAIIEKNWGKREEWGSEWETVTGDLLRKRLEGISRPAEEVSKEFLAAGIPGSKFLDQLSREPVSRGVTYKGQVFKTDRDFLAFERKTHEDEIIYNAMVGMRGETSVENYIARLEEQLKVPSPVPAMDATTRETLEYVKAHKEDFGKPTGTYNYVIFDDALIEMIERNGEAIRGTRRAAALDPIDYGTGPKPGWDYAPAMKPVTAVFQDREITVMPVATTPLKEVLGKIDLTTVGEFGEHLQPVVDRILAQAGDIPVYVLYNDHFRKLVQDKPGERTNGFYSWFGDPGKDHIVISTNTFYSKDMAKVVFHEAVHAATAKAIQARPELRTILNSLMSRLHKSNPDLSSLYGYKNEYEFLAETMSNSRFQAELAAIKLSEEWAQILGMKEWKEKTLWQGILEFIRQALNVSEGAFTALEGAIRVTELATDVQEAMGAQASVKGVRRAVVREAETLAAKEVQPELPGITPQSERKIFENARAIGMTGEELRLRMELIRKQGEEDREYIAKQAEKFERKKQTQEWREQEEIIRSEVEVDIGQRPDLALSEYFRTGRLYDEKGPIPRINPKSLSEEQKALFPEKWQRRDGMDANDVAHLFGYDNVDAMVQHLAKLEQDMAAAGETRVREYKQGLINAETESRMMKEFGNLEENILREAQEHVISPTQMDLLHQEVVALGMKVGGEMPFERADMKKWAEQQFSQSRAATASVETFLKDAGRAGRMAEMALLRGDHREAFKEKQRQFISILMADQAKAFAKRQAQAERLFERYGQRVVKGRDQLFTDFTQELLVKAGIPVKRTAAELKTATARTGFETIRQFVESNQRDGWELSVDETVLSGQTKTVDQMTVREYTEFADSVKSMDWVSGKLGKFLSSRIAETFDEWKTGVIENISQLPPRVRKTAERYFYHADAWLVRPEEMFKDLDLRKELGPLFNAIVRPMMDAKHTEFSMLEKLAQELRDIKKFDKKWSRTMKDEIPNDFLTDPYDGALFSMSRENMIHIMLNFGNRSNIEKFTKGYGGKEGAAGLEARLWQMFDQHATKQDWEYVQKIWDIWEGWRKEADKLYYELSGVPPKWIEPTPITNKHGTFSGGYYPIIYDRLASHIGVIEERAPSPGDKGLFPTNYHRATPGNSYTKERTGYVDAVQFVDTIESIASRMQQTIHDISYRRAVMDVGKIIYDRDVRAAIRKHYGIEYERQLDPWLKDVANHFNMDEKKNAWVNRMLRRIRFNLVSHALGLNLKVLFSPDIGQWDPRAHTEYVANWEVNQALVYAKSKEIPHTFRNIDRDFRERLEHTIRSRGWSGFQAEASRWGFIPLVKFSQLFREATFFKEYKAGLRRGLTEGEAAAVADSLVRERHGTGAVVDLPAVLRTNEAMKMMTLFYGFFSTMYNWQRQLPGQFRRGEYMAMAGNLYGSVLIPAAFGAVLFNQQKEGDSWFKVIAKALPMQMLSTIPFVRDASNYIFEGFSARTPLASVINAGGDAVKDMKAFAAGKPVKKPITHAANVIGLGSGLPLAQAGRTTQFAFDVAMNKQRPRHIGEWIRGVITGEARLKKK